MYWVVTVRLWVLHSVVVMLTFLQHINTSWYVHLDESISKTHPRVGIYMKDAGKLYIGGCS